MESTTRELLKSLCSRFPPSELIQATMMTLLKNWPHLTGDQLKGAGFNQLKCFGEKEVAVLYKQFGQVVFPNDLVTLEDVIDEWSTLRTLVMKRYPEMKDVTWERVIGDLSDQNLDNVLKLVEVVLAFPPTSVKCETAFSAMKLLKTKRRGRLANTRLNDLMAIKIMSPDIEEFDPEPAIADWMMSTPSGQKLRVGERVKKVKRSQETNEASQSQTASEASHSQSISESDSDSDTDTPATSSEMQVIQKQLSDEEDSEDDCDMEMSEDLVFAMLHEF